MQELFLRLVRGDQNLAVQFKEARKSWNEFIEEFGGLPVSELADKFSLHQARLEWPFEQNRPFAKEMLPIAGLATLWNEEKDDFDDPALARRIVDAMKQSTMSWEIVHTYLDAALEVFPLGAD
jgi:hypothetical protein